MVLCILLLPLCLLDEESQTQLVKDSDLENYLLENGFSVEEANTIRKDQDEFLRLLEENKVQLVVEPEDTAKSLEDQIRGIHPSVSKVYLEFIVSIHDL